jgi:hypothetical protein
MVELLKNKKKIIKNQLNPRLQILLLKKKFTLEKMQAKVW